MIFSGSPCLGTQGRSADSLFSERVLGGVYSIWGLWQRGITSIHRILRHTWNTSKKVATARNGLILALCSVEAKAFRDRTLPMCLAAR